MRLLRLQLSRDRQTHSLGSGVQANIITQRDGNRYRTTSNGLLNSSKFIGKTLDALRKGSGFGRYLSQTTQ